MVAQPADYTGAQKILLLLEDDPEQRALLEEAGRRYFSDDASSHICVVESTGKAKTALAQCQKDSPEAIFYVVTDYNMGLNEPGERKPTEALFFDDAFQHFLKNGGFVVVYSGYPEQVKQSQVILEAMRKYEKTAILIAVKGVVSLDDLFRLLQATQVEAIPRLKEVAEKCQFDLGNMLAYFKKA